MAAWLVRQYRVNGIGGRGQKLNLEVLGDAGTREYFRLAVRAAGLVHTGSGKKRPEES
jgi:hypothetical protein